MRNSDNASRDGAQERHSEISARELAKIAASRRTPKMHWRWCKRSHDIEALLRGRFLHNRFRSTLPQDDAGLDAVQLVADHYIRLNLDAERVVRNNLKLWTSWLTEPEIVAIIMAAKKAKAKKEPSAAQLGKAWRVTTEEVATYGLTTITAYTVTLEKDRNRQASRRRNAGAGTKRGRRSLGLSANERKLRTKAQDAKRAKVKRTRSSVGRPCGRPKAAVPAWKLAGARSKAAYYRNLKKAETSETQNASRKNRHASFYIRTMKRDGLSVTGFMSHGTPIGIMAMVPADLKRLVEINIGIRTTGITPSKRGA